MGCEDYKIWRRKKYAAKRLFGLKCLFNSIYFLYSYFPKTEIVTQVLPCKGLEPQ
jgi:hypothetical protein